jgi:hypothetical protein
MDRRSAHGERAARNRDISPAWLGVSLLVLGILGVVQFFHLVFDSLLCGDDGPTDFSGTDYDERAVDYCAWLPLGAGEDGKLLVYYGLPPAVLLAGLVIVVAFGRAHRRTLVAVIGAAVALGALTFVPSCALAA